MIDLDNKQAVLKTQGGGAVLDSINALPNQLKQAWEESQKIDFPESYRNIKNIVVCGMGASRFPAFITQQLLKEKISVPYTISDNYTIPRYVNENTLFILSSYSGTTEEVLYNGKLALERNAKLTGLCSGGDVADFLKKTIVLFMFLIQNTIHQVSLELALDMEWAHILEYLQNLD